MSETTPVPEDPDEKRIGPDDPLYPGPKDPLIEQLEDDDVAGDNEPVEQVEKYDGE